MTEMIRYNPDRGEFMDPWGYAGWMTPEQRLKLRKECREKSGVTDEMIFQMAIDRRSSSDR